LLPPPASGDRRSLRPVRSTDLPGLHAPGKRRVPLPGRRQAGRTHDSHCPNGGRGAEHEPAAVGHLVALTHRHLQDTLSEQLIADAVVVELLVGALRRRQGL
jgi:hypothetical protein